MPFSYPASHPLGGPFLIQGSSVSGVSLQRGKHPNVSRDFSNSKDIIRML